MSADQRRPDKLEAALAAGKFGRAREILASRMGTDPFNPTTAEQLGSLLLNMGDDIQAGRYLFVSGVRKPEYQPSIDTFLRRHSRHGWRNLLAALPATVKRCAWSEIPSVVREELRQAGVPQRPAAETLKGTISKAPAGRLEWVGCLVVLAILAGIGLLVSVVIVHFYDPWF
jgi:hypothetical protein